MLNGSSPTRRRAPTIGCGATPSGFATRSSSSPTSTRAGSGAWSRNWSRCKTFSGCIRTPEIANQRLRRLADEHGGRAAVPRPSSRWARSPSAIGTTWPTCVGQFPAAYARHEGQELEVGEETARVGPALDPRRGNRGYSDKSSPAPDSRGRCAVVDVCSPVPAAVGSTASAAPTRLRRKGATVAEVEEMHLTWVNRNCQRFTPRGRSFQEEGALRLVRPASCLTMSGLFRVMRRRGLRGLVADDRLGIDLDVGEDFRTERFSDNDGPAQSLARHRRRPRSPRADPDRDGLSVRTGEGWAPGEGIRVDRSASGRCGTPIWSLYRSIAFDDVHCGAADEGRDEQVLRFCVHR